MNSVWTVVLIVAIVMIIYERHRTVKQLREGEQLRDRERETDTAKALDARQDPEVQRELDELRDRVKVLERITVDGREAKAIADEIEALRDEKK
ncbi:hypothetical protein [Qipengyuania sp. JC766]|uniref:hypothetical protein n=1 Tax=Qipengyuania sp. JC766 TaxID=3232139 RepID=UPI003458CCAB